jgi:type I restriction enzyme, S subunit
MRATFQRVAMGEVATFKTGKLDSNAAVENGAYPFFTCSRDTFRTNTYSFDDEVVLLAGNNANGIYPLKYFKGKFDAYQRTYVIRPIDESRLDTRFLYFALRPQLDHLRSVSTGSATKFLTMGLLSDLELPLPSLPTQRKIAGILSAYDDLIENNLRRIKILEQMAQSLYREWFVHFRFPSHESAKFVNSELGQIPKGWDVKAMTEAVTVRPKVSIPKGGDIPFVTMGGLSENSMLITEVESREVPTGARFQNGDTLFARITPCLENGKTGYAEFLPSDESAACGSTEFIVLRSKNVCPQYVYLMARSDAFRDNAIKSMSGATGRQRVRDECFDQFFLAQPPGDLLARFESITRPQFELIHSLNRRDQTLRRTRDLLLPKLLSGDAALFRAGNTPENLE